MNDSISRNRAHWEADATRWADAGRRGWAQADPTWGIWSVPESQVQLPRETAGADVVELGCGTGACLVYYFEHGS